MKAEFPQWYPRPDGYGLTPYQAEILTRSPWLAMFFEELCFYCWLCGYTPTQVANVLINIPKFTHKWVPLIETEMREQHYNRGCNAVTKTQ